MTKTLKVAAVPALTAIMLIGGALVGYAGMASAQTSTTGTGTARTMPARVPHVDGTITAINGSTITITAEADHGSTQSGTYTIDASNATVTKDGASATLSSLAVGDKVFAEGTLSGTSVVATKIGTGRGFGPGGRGFGGPKGHGMGLGVMGTVSGINGSTITVTGKDGVSYTVNAGSATVHKMATVSVSDITIGDTIGVQGAVSGTSVTATTIMDGLPKPPGKTQ